ncbi:hypothetical protein [Dysosmobacter welbionis]|uniref:hypothetical protein n=1 Tax=Dysosmobacter welbionis TaxID=2093857 RepID=UPI00300EA043
MAVSKFRIYDYWKDKAITKKFEIKPVSACTKEDDALSITEFPDEHFLLALVRCRAYEQGPHRSPADFGMARTLYAVPYFVILNVSDAIWKPEN